ncbi:hypothetical protein N7448_001014 [Penicillium atrosanguineum]|uniref:Uncharacterized protein n=1 Tax=Penicillium atrosanguineum TaxID=1132637 RepID=A0A9W9UA19_9EURO|nr:uncharacterized protein N7443_004412 [Penicillium atrosanguineum]KAJ5133965.1 hypothetical protein N7526_005330 [Penicillium atrosanguineum]KAJ5149436.1 hypothetical protein N7448_001014 [Penicillium atrosanguineum]KAJ5304752.1 hypothetical protein N7443_004412 [Penicillium atrosanguineum]KAJ5324214.1 hypothetical protein N7476_002814 [Penicillium atrosanguineum]
MFTLPLILAAGSLPLIFGAPVPSTLSFESKDITTHSLNGRSTDLYSAVFGGDGLVSDGWPALEEWISSFDDMFESNRATIKESCAQFDVDNNSDEETDDIKSAIASVAESSGLDSRFILAIVMQESNGCVRVKTTNYGVNNPGLMQSHDGTGSCNDGTPTTPCPQSEIHQMILDGASGTSAGAGLKQCVEQYGGTGDVTNYYKAARCYNSGSVASNGNLGAGIATGCYVSDIANRLLGWSSGTSMCSESSIASLTGSNWSGGQSSSDTSSSASASVSSSTSTPTSFSTSISTATPEPTTTSEATPTIVATTTPTVVATTTPVIPTQAAVPSTPVIPAPVATSSAASSVTPSAAPAQATASSAAAPIYPYATTSCTQYTTITGGEFCDFVDTLFGITVSTLQSLNPGLDSSCSNLWLGYQYCVKA